eukprot:m.49298 g.49298  ORF g.49298 m.49298 type:complete len:297 (-) comp6105_c0_seq2:69-959(-)
MEDGNIQALFQYANGTCDVDLKCVICLAPCWRALEHGVCGKLFCSDCINKCDTCPNCRADLSTLHEPSRFVLNKLDELLVVCPNSPEHIMPRANLIEHLRIDCPLQRMDCPCADFGCNFASIRAALPAHLQECRLYPILAALQTMRKRTDEQATAASQQVATLDRTLAETRAVAWGGAQQLKEITVCLVMAAIASLYASPKAVLFWMMYFIPGFQLTLFEYLHAVGTVFTAFCMCYSSAAWPGYLATLLAIDALIALFQKQQLTPVQRSLAWAQAKGWADWVVMICFLGVVNSAAG